jgi:hypothetical protein
MKGFILVRFTTSSHVQWWIREGKEEEKKKNKRKKKRSFYI